MLTIYDNQMNQIGILENAFQVGNYERKANELSSFSFSIPLNDPKNDLLDHFHYVELVGQPMRNNEGEEIEEGRRYGLFRIMPKKTKKSQRNNRIEYECEHVLATLLDDVIEGLMEAKQNWTTRENLQRILDLQTTENWVLGQVDFERYFEYAFENENGLLAPILSIPEPIDEPFLFTTDTTSYPWTLNLIRPSDELTWDIHWGRDMQSFDEVSEPEEIVNHIIPKGAGEGVNQLTIEDINNGVRYLEDADSITQYGLKKYIWIDRRFKNAESLKASAQSLLDQQKVPKISFDIKAIDLSLKEEFKHLKRPFYTVGEINVEGRKYQARIVSERIADMEKEHEAEYDIENKLDDIATIQADVERKVEVNEAYSQGATNHDSVTLSENCDANYPLRFRIWIPDDVLYVNTMILTYETTYFRGYTKGSEAGGYFQQPSVVKSESTEGGGAFTKDEEIVSETTEGGGGQTTSDAGDHDHELFQTTGSFESSSNMVTEANNKDGMIYLHGDTNPMQVFRTHTSSGTHSHTAPVHTHEVKVTIPGLNLEPHTHGFSVEIPGIEIQDHTHEQIYGIYESNEEPSQLTISVDGNELSENSTSAQNVDLVPYLQKNQGGGIQRNRWATIEISPDTLARINATVVTRLFIQSNKGGKY